jgi:hypothetical protein
VPQGHLRPAADLEIDDFMTAQRTLKSQSQQPALCSRCELNVCAHPADDIRLTHRACLTRDFATRFEEDQGGNAANAKFAGDVLRGVSIELRQAYLGFQLCSRLGVLRRRRLTGTTPRSPEVHDHRNVITLDVTAEIVSGELDRMTREQRLMAMPTLRCLAEARSGNAVDRVAVRTHDVRCI